MADQYFSSYADLSVHKLMLSDKPRMESYKLFIEENSYLFKDKVVMDVGAGTGILALFAAAAGAKHVYAVEASGMSTVCQQIVDDNDYTDTITVIHGDVEDVEIEGLAENSVDILLSEWMGFYLLHESMLTSLIVARERWLSMDGLMVPSLANIYACPVNMDDLHRDEFGFWKDVSGFNMTAMVPFAKADVYSKPVVAQLKPEQCLAEPKRVARFESKYVQPEDIARFKSNLTFKLNRDAVMDGICCWFDVVFENDDDSRCKSRTLSTSPSAAPTHWKQSTILFPQRIALEKEEQFVSHIVLQQDEENPRFYNISIELMGCAAEDNDCAEAGGGSDMQEEIKQHLLEALQKNNQTSDEEEMEEENKNDS